MSDHQNEPLQENPLLKRIRLPGETHTLPSGGLFYKNGELDSSVKNAEVHIHPMTALDEIALKTPDLLFSGEAVKQVFARCIPQILRPEQLFIKDVDFLLVCLRKISFGDEMRVSYTHSCEKAETHTYTIDVTEFIRRSKRIDPTQIGANFTVTLDNGQVVTVEPMRYANFIHMMQRMNEQEDKTTEQIRNEMVDSLTDAVVQVDEVTNKEFIREFLAAAAPKHLKKIKEKVESSADWGPDFDVKIKCMDCDEVVTIRAPMNPLSFFT